MAAAERASGGVVGRLSSWRDGPAKQAIDEFVARVCGEDGSEPVAVEDRLAVFDNDGTLWCEKPMLHFTQHEDKPFLRLLILHDDDEREFAYTTGGEQALDQAARCGWTVISVKNDWATVF
jgi:hypothetical protein